MNQFASYKFLLLLICVLFSSLAFAQPALFAQTDRNTIAADENFKLTITINGQAPDGDIDLAPLTKDFEILSTAKSKQFSMINGSISSQTQWLINLAPKHTGSLIIPALKISNLQTNPLQIVVTPINTATRNNKNLLVFLEAEATPTNPYLQSQVVYTLRFFYAVDIQSGTLSDPTADNILISQLGNDISYAATRNNKRYQVIERRYAIFPQKSGLLTIQPSVFKGAIMDYQSAKGLNIFLTDNARPIRVVAPSIDLQVQPKPPALTSSWLPTAKLILTSAWSANPGIVRVGEPITRTITIQALGLNAAQLPSVPLTNLTDVKQYPDKPELTTLTNGNSILGKRIEKIAFLPTKPGKFVLPAIQIPWWNTQTHQQETASLPAVTLNIIPAAGGSNINSAATVDITTPKNKQSESIASTIKNNQWIFTLSGIFFILWLITLWAWWRQKQTKKRAALPIETNQKPSLKALQLSIEQACLANKPQQTKDALLAWTTQVWPNKTIRNLNELAEQFSSSEIKTLLHELDKFIYANLTQAWDGKTFWSKLSLHLSVVKAPTPLRKNEPLPPLYPQNE